MKITQIRNATIVIHSKGYNILVDPMLSKKGTNIPFKLLTIKPKLNPIVDLPNNANEILKNVTHSLITHCQKGHFDHLDKSGVAFLKSNYTPVYCSKRDYSYLTKKGLDVILLPKNKPTTFLDGTIELTECIHGSGWINKFMEHGVGYFIKLKDEPSIYLTGDTVLTDYVKQFVIDKQPDIVIAPAGKAQLDFGKPILMGTDEILELASLMQGKLIANHLEALDHCTTTRKDLAQIAKEKGFGNKIIIPKDGEVLVLN
ncbi:MAG: MBL fold metallo-hydrolase [Melioribacteraceae bacterium]